MKIKGKKCIINAKKYVAVDITTPISHPRKFPDHPNGNTGKRRLQALVFDDMGYRKSAPTASTKRKYITTQRSGTTLQSSAVIHRHV
jgi:hypothetical protein